jgi:hypothetical protein
MGIAKITGYDRVISNARRLNIEEMNYEIYCSKKRVANHRKFQNDYNRMKWDGATVDSKTAQSQWISEMIANLTSRKKPQLKLDKYPTFIDWLVMKAGVGCPQKSDLDLARLLNR